MKRELTRREAEFLDGILGDMSAERWLEQLQEFVMDATLLTIKTDVQDSTPSSGTSGSSAADIKRHKKTKPRQVFPPGFCL